MSQLNIHPKRGGVEVTLEPLRPGVAASVSESWTVAGWSIQFVDLGANQKLDLNQGNGKIYLKVVTGALAKPSRGAFAAPQAPSDTLVAEDAVEAGPDGARFAILTETAAVAANVSSMDQLVFEGPLQEAFEWKRLDEKFGSFTNLFDGLEAYASPGFHVLEPDGSEIFTVTFWTVGTGVDLSTHNHSNNPSKNNPAFAEIHWVFNNGTGDGAMYIADGPEGNARKRIPLQRGQEHGPFFLTNPTTRLPEMLDNGAVRYPWHGWKAGVTNDNSEAYDFFAAFEINPKYARL